MNRIIPCRNFISTTKRSAAQASKPAVSPTSKSVETPQPNRQPDLKPAIPLTRKSAPLASRSRYCE
jgi:hypothetical protein